VEAAVAGAAHELVVMTLRDRPEVFGALLQRLAGRAVQGPLSVLDSSVRFADVNEVRPDLVYATPQKPWVVLEVQQAIDEAKRRRWPLVVSVLTDDHQAMGELVVLTPRRSVARWAQQAVRWVGDWGTALTLQPVVLLVDLATAEALLATGEPSLALVAAWALQKRYGPRSTQTARRALVLTTQLPSPQRGRQARAILQMLSPRLQAELKELLMNLDRLQDPDEKEAFRALMQDLEGPAEARGEAKSLLRYLARRGVALTEAQRAQLAGCTDVAQLERWQDAAFAADSADAIRKALFG
jgi:hypothetical protein